MLCVVLCLARELASVETGLHCQLQIFGVLPVKKFTLMRKNSASILGLVQTKLVLGGITALSRAKIVFITPAIPLAPSRCPMLLFTAPLSDQNISGRALSGTRISQNAVRRRTRVRLCKTPTHREDHPKPVHDGIPHQERWLLLDHP